MSQPGRSSLLKSDPSTIRNKFMVGYQGWFTCAGDGEPVGPGHHGWLHWFTYPIPDGGRPNVDLWPDVTEYSPSELYPAPGLKIKSTNEQAFLFSSRHPETVRRHFHWMARVNVDGAFLQRFVGQCDIERGQEGIRRIRDEVGDRVREAAEKEGRVFAIMYDVSGVEPGRVQGIIERDWLHLVHKKRLLDSPNYLREHGKPVIALWGFGFADSGHSPDLVRRITAFLRSATPGGVYLVAGTPAHWRTSSDDADRNPDFLNVWLNEFDMISPWTVGRYRTAEEADKFSATKTKGDIELLEKRNQEGTSRKVDYMPVVLPGGSGYNLSEGKWGFNDTKRDGGRFLWQQIHNANRLGAKVVYGAMWDEYDEGTAFMPAVEKKRNLPHSDKYPFLALDEDGYDIPSDWYMRICGFAGEGLRGERRIYESFPSKELQDYWSTHPKYETTSEDNTNSNDASGSGSSSYQSWIASQTEEKDELPPPPYSLEAENTNTESVPSSTNISQQSFQNSNPVQATTNVGQGSLNAAHYAPSPPLQPNVSQSYGTQENTAPVQSAAQTQHPHPGTPDPMQPLIGNFGRQRISSIQERPPPPPKHPSRPGHSPAPRPVPPRPPQASSPAPLPYLPASVYDQKPAGPALPAQWPPTEWQTTSPQSTMYPIYHPHSSPHSPASPHFPGTYASPNSTNYFPTPEISPYGQSSQGKPGTPLGFNHYGGPETSYPTPSSPRPGSNNSSQPVSPYPQASFPAPSIPSQYPSIPSGPQEGSSYSGYGHGYPFAQPYPNQEPQSSMPAPNPYQGSYPADYNANARPGHQPGPSNSNHSGAPQLPAIAISTLDMLAGRRQREQLESTINNIAKTSNKLLGKFGR